ncbi:MAG: TetR family transcriptional regulator [Aeromicrobium sp.]|uniref:TetR/AcrR family transcriptional regulator n=1 Tax=Aeromicrobium sp. TaxID=1871063 RepID=UPI0039E2F4C4
MASRAQLSQARSRARRDALLEAALELFAEGGARAITHRAVAARAGLPPATTTYYFTSITELVREALSHHLQTWIDTLRALTDVEFDTSADIDAAAAFIETVYSARSPEIAGTQLAIYLASARDPELRELAAQALTALDDLTRSMLTRLRIESVDTLASAITALIAGSAFRRQSGASSDAEEARLLATSLRHLVAAHLLGEDAVTTALRTGK